MSWNDEDEVRELRAELAQLRASLRALAEEMAGECQWELAGAYAGRIEELGTEPTDEEDD